MEVRTASPDDWDWIVENAEPIGGTQVVSLGRLHKLRDHEAIIATYKDQRLGYVVYRSELPSIEVLAILAMEQWSGVGKTLMGEVEKRAKHLDVDSIFLTTTNDNLSAIRFYQRGGFYIREVHPGEFKNILKIKGYDPEVSVVGQDGIVIRDEFVLEKLVMQN